MTGSYWHIGAGCDGQLSDHFQKFAPSRSEGLTFQLASQSVVCFNWLSGFTDIHRLVNSVTTKPPNGVLSGVHPNRRRLMPTYI